MKKYLITLLTMLCAAGAYAEIATDAVRHDFESRRNAMAGTDYFSIFDRSDLSGDRLEAMQVLYAYMPLPDITDHSGEYFLENVDVALRGRRELPWGTVVPDREFRHFVLPVRVNNEDLDGHRRLFYDELLPRVKNLTMEEAILEINHWCHEKAVYQPSDARTHSPLMTVYSAIGRCGEESTFTVAALRAMGIPARQVYTPRWAHTDDNHAWVEAWADGKWHFLGACEPEAVLDLGWFNAPAARGMLMNTRVFGRYDGPEEVLMRLDGYTDINVTPNYAPTDSIEVTVVDADGRAVAGAEVSFRVYNYSEFYPIAVKTTDANGRASLLTGLGDMVVWVRDGEGNYGVAKRRSGTDRTLTVPINKGMRTVDAGDLCGTSTLDGRLDFELDIVPPSSAAAPVEVPADKAACNLRRLAVEDSLRTIYTSTFADAAEIDSMASALRLDRDRLAGVLLDARGNHRVAGAFLGSLPEAERSRGLRLLEVMSKKDRSDMSLDVMRDHMLTTEASAGALYDEYVLNPRVENEMIVAWRGMLRNAVGEADAARFRANPALWVDWVRANIDASMVWNPSTVIMSPVAVRNYRKTNRLSRNVFFVAGARAMGIPSRVDAVNGKPMWADGDGCWHEAVFDAPAGASASPKGELALTYTPTGRIDDPKYYTHFSLSEIKDGRPELLTYPDFEPWSRIFDSPVSLDAGNYMLVTGQRMADGSVLSQVSFIPVEAGKLTTAPLVMRQDSDGVQVIGSFDAESIYHDLAADTDKSVLSTTGRGYYVLGLIRPGHEPSNHALRDIAALRSEFEAWGRPMLLLFADAADAARHDASQLPELPSNVVVGTDNADGSIAASLVESLKLPASDRPIFIIADTFNRVVFMTQGYTIGLGDRLIDTIHKLK